MAFLCALLKDSKAADRHFRVHFEAVSMASRPVCEHLRALTPELMVPRPSHEPQPF